MRKYIYILVLVFLSVALSAQESDTYYYEDDFPAMSQPVSKAPFKTGKTPLIKEENFKFRLTTGSSFTSFYGNNLFSTYVMPEVRYQFNEKFSISAGILTTFNYFPNLSYPGTEGNTPMNSKYYNNNYLFAKGEYQVNDRIRLRAATFFDVGSPSGEGRTSFNNVGLDLKIAEKTYISADFNIYKTNNKYPTFYSPFGGYFDNFHANPIGNTSFTDRFEW
ncbi:MAG: hypothetical protein LBQ22_04510 [Bacteroidales bacterium]|jgi:hypothetical protein|nr:hypothetical protein [Bacteroidales bacterium]